MEKKSLFNVKLTYVYYFLVGMFCALMLKAEHDLYEFGNINWNLKYVISIFLLSALAGGAIGVIICKLTYKINAYEINKVLPNNKYIKLLEERSIKGKGIFVISFLLIIIAWFPTFLAYFPAICSYDITIQLEQIVANTYNEHHPIIHTLMIEYFMQIGENLFKSVNAGIGLYALVQQTFLASVMAYSIYFLSKYGCKLYKLIVLLLIYMFYPFNWYMSVSATKDTIFSGFFMLSIIAMVGLLIENFKKIYRCSYAYLFLISAVLMILFRKNGLYVLLVPVVITFFIILFVRDNRIKWIQILMVFVIAIVLGSLLTSVLAKSVSAGQGDKREMLSMPIQQLARTMLYHGGLGLYQEDDNGISQVDKELINDFLLNESYRNYRVDISDPVKSYTNTYVFRYRTGEFMRTYVGLFMKYPGDYINAILGVNAGYLSPLDTTHAYINVNGRDKGLGYIQTRWVDSELNRENIIKDSKLKGLHKLLEKMADDNFYLHIPLIKYIFVPGIFLWLYLLLVGKNLVLKKYKLLVVLSVIGGLYLTLFLGPTVQLRYLYPVIICLPFLEIITKREEE